MKKRKIIAADLFCGAGGTSTGLIRACRKMGIDIDLLAVNHWDTAIETHTKNHPGAKHVCKRLDQIRPEDAIPGGRLHLLVASPECTHHSIARGGRPMNDQSRSSAWDILNWAQKLYIDNILIENVKEFRNWGPLGANGRPLKSQVGKTFDAFLIALKALGYTVEFNILNAANYGDATTRERLFIIARRGHKKIIWPEQTHAPSGNSTLFSNQKAWRSAREIIDWSIPGKSIFGRKKPLADATLRRIEAGLRKFGGRNAEPFLVVLRNNQNASSIDKPVPTLTTSGANFALCEPFVLGQQSGSVARSVEEPIPTVSTDGAIALVEAFILPQFGESGPRSIDRPVGTITTTSRGMGLCEPFVLRYNGGDERVHGIHTPVPVIDTSNRYAVVEPFLATVNHGGGEGRRCNSIDAPIPTVTTQNGLGLVEPFLVQYNGTSDPQPIHEPLPTATTKERFGVVTLHGEQYYLDIRFRMLQPHELAAAMSFPADYQFVGNREAVVKQIGNAVPGYLSEALCGSLLRDYAEGSAA